MKNFIHIYSRTWKKLAVILIALFVTDILGVLIYYQSAQHFVSNQSSVSRADVGIVFFGDYDWSRQKLGCDTSRRLEQASFLYLSQKINNIVCVGGARKSEKFFGSLEMRDYLVDNRIDPKDIFCDSLSYDTKTNWYEALKIIDNNQFNRIVVISSPLHVYRIARIIDRKNVYFSPYTYNNDSISDYFSIYTTIHHEWTAIIFSAVFSEKIYLKMLHWYRN